METWRFPEIGVALNHPNLRWCFPLWPIHYGGTSMYGTPHMTFQLPSIPLLSLLTVWSSLPSLPAAAHGTHVLAPWTAHGGAETQDGKAEREAIYFLLSILFEPIRRKIEGLTVWEHDVAIMGSLEPHTWHIGTPKQHAEQLQVYHYICGMDCSNIAAWPIPMSFRPIRVSLKIRCPVPSTGWSSFYPSASFEVSPFWGTSSVQYPSLIL